MQPNTAFRGLEGSNLLAARHWSGRGWVSLRLRAVTCIIYAIDRVHHNAVSFVLYIAWETERNSTSSPRGHNGPGCLL